MWGFSCSLWLKFPTLQQVSIFSISISILTEKFMRAADISNDWHFRAGFSFCPSAFTVPRSVAPIGVHKDQRKNYKYSWYFRWEQTKEAVFFCRCFSISVSALRQSPPKTHKMQPQALSLLQHSRKEFKLWTVLPCFSSHNLWCTQFYWIFRIWNRFWISLANSPMAGRK